MDPRDPRLAVALFGLLASGCACGSATAEAHPAQEDAPRTSKALALTSGGPPRSPGESAPAVSAVRRAESLTLALGGDVNLGRHVGQRLLAMPEYDPLRGVRPFLEDAAITFVNLESPLSDQGGETRHPVHANVFTGPPCGAGALHRAGVGVASVANNHAWDYGKDGFQQTLDNLGRAGVRAAGLLGEDEAIVPTVVRADGWSVAFFAVTDPWNPGDLSVHEARPFVARHDADGLLDAIRRASVDHDVVVVSAHAGKEYSVFPRHEDIAAFRSYADAGADVVVGHHPHVLQGISWHHGVPILHSLGNLVFGVHRDHPWAGRGAVARVTARRDASVSVALCLFGIVLDEPHRLSDVGMEHRTGEFYEHLEAISEPLGGVKLGEMDARGCISVDPATDRDRSGAPRARRR